MKKNILESFSFSFDTISYVLGKLTKKEQEQINNDMNKYFGIIDTFINSGLDGVIRMQNG